MHRRNRVFEWAVPIKGLLRPSFHMIAFSDIMRRYFTTWRYIMATLLLCLESLSDFIGRFLSNHRRMTKTSFETLKIACLKKKNTRSPTDLVDCVFVCFFSTASWPTIALAFHNTKLCCLFWVVCDIHEMDIIQTASQRLWRPVSNVFKSLLSLCCVNSGITATLLLVVRHPLGNHKFDDFSM